MLNLRKSKSQKAITLIALIITIVVLLILAAVAITAITKYNIIDNANLATKKYSEKSGEEDKLIGEYNTEIDKYMSQINGGITPGTVLAVANKPQETNTKVVDVYGNKIVIPAGFKIRVDDTTNNADTVIEGIVIEDCTETSTKGSQFVWIPVGKIYTDVNKTEEKAKTIALERYVFADGTNDANGDGTILAAGKISMSTTNPSQEIKTITTDKYYYTEGLKNSTTVNAHARDIEAFIASTDPVTGNGGYYIGRYEARKNAEGNVTSLSTDSVWNSINQATATSKSQGMYPDGYKTGTFSSDLINSYAWDTAIVFLQTFDNRKDTTTPYAYRNSLNVGSVNLAGTGKDLICNIYDMASNCLEWSTETCGKTRWYDISTRCA